MIATVGKSATYRECEKLLKATGLPWSIVPGKKHHHAFLNGEFVGAISRGKSTRHDCKELHASIRRIVRNANAR